MSITDSSSLQNGAVSYDMGTAFVSDIYDYSTVGRQDMALQVPLGSQLALLNAQNAGNPYVDYGAVGFSNLGSLQNVLPGYNTLGQTLPAGKFFNFSQAYGRF